MTSGRAPSGKGVLCRRCGGVLAFSSLAPTVRCPFCGEEQAIDPGVLAAIARYGDQVRADLDQADRNRQAAAHWEQYRVGMRPLDWVVLALALLVPPALVVLAVNAAESARLISHGMRNGLLGTGMDGSIMAGVIAYAVWYSRRRRRPPAPTVVPSIRISCPSCGAALPSAAGQPFERCPFCEASLLPSPQVMDEGLTEAEQESWRAQMESVCAERRGMAGLMNLGVKKGAATTVVTMMTWMFPLGAGAVIFSIAMIRGQEPWHPAILVLWAAVILAIAVAVLLFRRRRERRRLLHEALAALSATSGYPNAGSAGVADWLNAHWAGPYDLADLACGEYGCNVGLHCQGYPVLVYVDPGASRRIQLLLAACLPPSVRERPAVALREPGLTAPVGELERSGFSLEASRGGLLARGEDRSGGLHRHPEAVLELARAITALQQVARGLGGKRLPAPSTADRT